MMRVLLVIAAAATVLVLPTSAGAHGGGWYWTRAAAENYIIDRTTTSDDEDIAEATCTGMGTPMRRSGRFLWHHLRCDENDDVDREFTVVFHPTSRYHAVVIEITCDDSYSDYACP